MTRYLMEAYLAGGGAGRLAGDQRALVDAAESMGEGRVRLEESIYIPEDETCFYVFDAQSAAEVADLALRANLGAIRIVEAVTSRREQA